MKVKTPPPDPGVTQAQLGMTRTAQAAETRAADNDAYYRNTFAPRYLEQMDQQLSLAREESARQRELADYATARAKKFDGLQDTYLEQVDKYDSEDNRERMAGMAIADVQRGLSDQRGQMSRMMQASGLNPNSGKYLSMLANQQVSAGLGQAAAANMAREAARREGMAMRGAASGMGQSYLGQAGGFGMASLGAGGMGMDAVSGAANGWNGANAGWNSTMGLAANGWNGAGSMAFNNARLRQGGRTQGANWGGMLAGGLQGFASGGWAGAIGGGIGGGMNGFGRSVGG